MVIPSIYPTRETFLALARDYQVIPVWCEIVTDVETPISAFQKIGSMAPSFLFESAEQNNIVGRFSFLGTGTRLMIRASGRTVTVSKPSGVETFEVQQDPLAEVEKLMAAYRIAPFQEVPRFCGGAVGYLSFDAVRYFEPSISNPPKDDLGVPDLFFMLTELVITFDHQRRRMKIIVNAFIEGQADAEAIYDQAIEQMNDVLEKLRQPTLFDPIFTEDVPQQIEPCSNTSKSEFFAMIEQMQEYIKAGDIFQVVPSQRFEAPFQGDPIDLYRALRFLNPSPYMFCLRCPGGYALVGSSPEVHVRVTDELIEIRPLAGTRPRGKTEAEDKALAEELLADPKERAEHVMLVDLARNDVGRVAKFGSIKVMDFLNIERYSHVMHIVSHISGELDREQYSSFDVMRATFPAGTVSGAPKVRAIQIINELEKNKRCTYAGAVGYFGFDGNLDSCIALRTVLLKDGKAYIQAGGGLVADSTPEGEYQESINKAKAAMRAIERARNRR